MTSEREKALEAALQKIAGTHFERVGYDQSDVEDCPDYDAYGAMMLARQALAIPADDSEPVAWRVKDFADGWILCPTEKATRTYTTSGHLAQPLYTHPSPSISDDMVERVTWRYETEAEHAARDMREGRFPERSALEMVPDKVEQLYTITDEVRGEIAYALTKRLVIDMPTARAAVDAALEAALSAAPKGGE